MRNFGLSGPTGDGGTTTGGALASRDRGARESQISPEFRDRVAMFACFIFFGFIASVLGISAYIVSSLIDWYGVGETVFRFTDLG